MNNKSEIKVDIPDSFILFFIVLTILSISFILLGIIFKHTITIGFGIFGLLWDFVLYNHINDICAKEEIRLKEEERQKNKIKF
jgi:hypothetical protein